MDHVADIGTVQRKATGGSGVMGAVAGGYLRGVTATLRSDRSGRKFGF